MIRMASAFVCVVLVTATAQAADTDRRVTLRSLLRQMTDLSALAEFPDPPYVTKQFSSYDRASETPKDPEHWFANSDRGFMFYDGTVEKETPYFRTGPQQGRTPHGHFPAGTKVGIAPTHKAIANYVWAYATAPDGRAINGRIPQGYIDKSAIRMDPQGHVLAEMDGPGCIVRIWSADPEDAGNIRIYLDHAKTTVINAPLKDLLGGKWQIGRNGEKWTPFPDPIACERSRGYNLYFPIAYARHCKVCTDKSDFYYHLDYRAYPSSTELETFSLDRLSGEKEEVASAVQRLKGEFLHEGPLGAAEMVRVTALPSKGVTLFNLHGSTPLVNVALTLRRATNPTAALRSLVLIGTFDNAPIPQIWCPVGDFFGSSPGVNSYRSLPYRVEQEGEKQTVTLRCDWSMPFEKSATLKVHNFGNEAVNLEAFAQSMGAWTDRSMHFHAKWRTETLNTRPFRDWNFCELNGQGVFVGDMLSVMNPVSAWWGEGDEKIYVDGESFPSWFGTGTEDYFGYAWSWPKTFQHPYHNQTRCDGPGTFGHTSVNRFHILDNIPFTKSFRFDMEFWHWTPNVRVPLATTCYWYARPGATDNFQPVDAKILQEIPSPPPPFKVAGALEAESLKIGAKSSDFPIGPQDMLEFSDGQWSDNRHLWGRPPKQGEWADLELPVAAAGKYHVIVYLTKARDYGMVQFSVNGTPLGKPIDGFHADTVVSTGAIDLGVIELPTGNATLRVEVVGTNAKSDGLRYMWGLDCVVLKPAP
jgi:Protein of unknown function (DUF2961)